MALPRSKAASNLRHLSESGRSTPTDAYFEMDRSSTQTPNPVVVEPVENIAPPVRNNDDNIAKLTQDIRAYVAELQTRPAAERRKTAVLLPIIAWVIWAGIMLFTGIQAARHNKPEDAQANHHYRQATFLLGWAGGMILFVSTALYLALFARRIWHGPNIPLAERNEYLIALKTQALDQLDALQKQEDLNAAPDTLLPVDRQTVTNLSHNHMQLCSQQPRLPLIALFTTTVGILETLQREIVNKQRPLFEDMGLNTLFAQPNDELDLEAGIIHRPLTPGGSHAA